MMDKWQSIHAFWSSFGIPAYDESSVPQDAQMPYITYNASTAAIGGLVFLSASLWYMSFSWEGISKKASEIEDYIINMHPPTILIDEGRVYITRSFPFAQRMSDEDDRVRRILLNINVEFLTN